MAIDKESAARAGLDIVTEHGLDELTVRRLADALGVKAPALYWHFRDKRALLDEMANTMLMPAAARLHELEALRPWWRKLEQSSLLLHDALIAQRDGGRIALGADIVRAHALGAYVEHGTVVLHAAGFTLPDASRAAATLFQLVIGRAVEEQARPGPEEELRLSAEPGFPFPALAQALHERSASPSIPIDDFGYSLRIVLEGLRAIHSRSRP